MAPPAPLTARHLGRATLARQGLLQPITAPAAKLVERAGSLQAQHPQWPPVAIGAEAERVLALLEPTAQRSVELVPGGR